MTNITTRESVCQLLVIFATGKAQNDAKIVAGLVRACVSIQKICSRYISLIAIIQMSNIWAPTYPIENVNYLYPNYDFSLQFSAKWNLRSGHNCSTILSLCVCVCIRCACIKRISTFQIVHFFIGFSAFSALSKLFDAKALWLFLIRPCAVCSK